MKKIKNFLRWFSPVFAVKTAVALYKEYKDWDFYRKTVDQLEADGFFNKHNMQVGKEKQFYFGVDIPPETLMQPEDEIERFEKQIIAREVSKLNEPLFKAGIFEYLETASERIKNDDYYGYVIMFSFNFRNFTFWKLVYSILYLGTFAGILAWVIFSGFGKEYVMALIDFFKNMG